jgi:maltooligosyltrehalose trehalohydrolase
MENSRRFPIGAEPSADGTTSFRVWAPKRRRVAVAVENGPTIEMQQQSDGYFAGRGPAAVGTRYRYRLDDDPTPYPDPASRSQPDGPHGPSEIVDPTIYKWSDEAWPGLKATGQVFYELHIGTFTPEGTWATAAAKLPALQELGVTAVEVMPVADFPGKFGWGYDGVNLFAPTRLYGRPDDFRAFIDHAHALGLGVILDVVYNHLGPDGNYLGQFADHYFTDRYKTDWGSAINYDGPDAGPVREFFASNAAYWIAEYHLDGLRLDATQNIYDTSDQHILADITAAARQTAGKRSIVIVAENELQETKLVRPVEKGGYGLDMVWNDDFNHATRVALTGRHEAYYGDYRGTPQELLSLAKYGYLYQGQWYAWQKKRRGTPTVGVPHSAFVTFLGNHDQVANIAVGLHVQALTSPRKWRAMTAFLLLGPGSPLLFQGQEFASSRPFWFFADHHDELAPLVRKGRGEFLSQFPSAADPAMAKHLPDPGDSRTFAKCKLDWSERDKNRAALELHRDLLRLRREDAAFREPTVDGAVIGPEAFALRFFGADSCDRLLLVNLGRDLDLRPAPVPLLAPPSVRRWQLLWSSEDPKYGGGGTPEQDADSGHWVLPGQAAVVLSAEC